MIVIPFKSIAMIDNNDYDDLCKGSYGQTRRYRSSSAGDNQQADEGK
jgi:hypothetical protein